MRIDFIDCAFVFIVLVFVISLSSVLFLGRKMEVEWQETENYRPGDILDEVA